MDAGRLRNPARVSTESGADGLVAGAGGIIGSGDEEEEACLGGYVLSPGENIRHDC